MSIIIEFNGVRKDGTLMFGILVSCIPTVSKAIRTGIEPWRIFMPIPYHDFPCTRLMLCNMRYNLSAKAIPVTFDIGVAGANLIHEAATAYIYDYSTRQKSPLYTLLFSMPTHQVSRLIPMALYPLIMRIAIQSIMLTDLTYHLPARVYRMRLTLI